MNLRTATAQPAAASGPEGSLLLEHLSDGVVLFEGGALPVYCNPAARRLLGVHRLRHRGDAEAILGRDLVQWLDQQRRIGSAEPGDRAVVVPAAGGPLPLQIRFQPYAGERWVLLLRPDPNAPDPRAPASPASLSELDQWFSLIPAGLIVADGGGRVLRSNPALEAMVGSVPGDLAQADATMRALLGWGGEADATPRVAGAPVERHVVLAAPDGRLRRVVARCQWHEPLPGQWRLLAVVEDRSAEDERDLARLEMGALMDTAGVGVATFEESRGWLKGAEPAATAPRSVAGLHSITRDMVLPSTLAEYERLQQALRRGDRVEVRYAVRHPELGVRWLQTRVEPGRLASRRTTSVVTLDVTDKEYAQRRSDELLRELTTLLDSTSAGIAYLRGTVLLRCNQRFETMLGLPAGGAAGAALDTLFGDGDGMAARLREGLAALDDTALFETEIVTVRPERRWMSLSVRRIPAQAGAEPEAVAVLTDISRLKLQQDELQKLLRERELMFNLSEVGIAYIRDERVERANESLATLVGRPLDELIGLSSDWLFEHTPLDAWPDGLAREAASPLQPGATAEWLLRRPDREPLWVEVSTRAVSPGDAKAGVICSFVDVDDRRRAREQLVVQAERTRAILDSVLVGIVTVGDNGIEWMNRSARRMFGGDLDDFVGHPISTVATPEPEHPLRRTDYLHALAEGRAESFECRLTARDGREFWVVGNVVVTGRESTGRQLTFALLDIERRRQAEIHIAQAQASLQRIIETVPLAIGLFDARSLRLVQANLMATSFLGVGNDDAIGMPLAQLFDPDVAADLARDMGAAGASAQGTRRELLRGGRDGDRLWEVRIVPLVAGEDASNGQQVLMVASDVTQERAAERARLDAAVAQRDMLVREVHHRIKNNLQGVAGLMQQIAIRRPEVAPVISEAIGQVQAIAQVYGLQVGVAGPLRVKSIIDAIAGSVQRMFGRSIIVDLAGGPPHRWALPEAESIPIALTVNELFTNAIKHGSKDAVRCTLSFMDDQVVMAIANIGQLPPDFDLAKVPGGVSGLGLVRALLPRRHARLTLVQQGADVVATIVLVPPGVALLEPL